MNYKKEIEYLRNETEKYIKSNNIKSLVIGLSGGIDSALACAISSPVCKKLEIPLIGLSLPSKTNKPDEIIRARKTGKYFCDQFIEQSIEKEYELFCARLKADEFPKRRGNIKARIRMIILYDKAQETTGMVLSTDNYTEFLLGFWTLHGDVGDFGQIQNYWKTEVYKMSEWIRDNELTGDKAIAFDYCIKANPTDGLGISNSDLDQIGVPTYKEVDYILQNKSKFKNHIVINRHVNSNFKRNNPFNIKRRSVYEKVSLD